MILIILSNFRSLNTTLSVVVIIIWRIFTIPEKMAGTTTPGVLTFGMWPVDFIDDPAYLLLLLVRMLRISLGSSLTSSDSLVPVSFSHFLYTFSLKAWLSLQSGKDRPSGRNPHLPNVIFHRLRGLRYHLLPPQPPLSCPRCLLQIWGGRPFELRLWA